MAISGPKQVQNVKASGLHVNSSVAALLVHTVDADGNHVTPGLGSSQVSVKEILTSSGASVMDSTNNAIGVTIRAGSASGTEYTDGDVDASIAGTAILFDNSSNTLRPVTLTRGLPVNIVAGAGSTQVSVKEILTSSGASVMDSTNSAIKVNVVAGAAGGSTQVSVKEMLTSSGASLMDSTNTALRVNVVAGAAGGSTIVSVSTLAGYVDILPAAPDPADYLPVRLTNGTAFSAPSTTVNVSSVAGLVATQMVDRDASTKVAAVLGGAPDSTSYGLVVRPVGASTTVNVSSIAGAVIVRSSAADMAVTASQGGTWNIGTVTTVSAVTSVSSLAGLVKIVGNNAVDGAVHVGDSTNNALRVNVVAGAAGGSTEVTIRQSTYADLNGLMRLADRDASTQVVAVLNDTPASTVWGLAVRQVGATPTSTTVNVSSLAGAVITRSSAADSLHTVYQSTFTDLNCRINAPSTANSSNFLPVRITNSTAYLDGSLEYTDASTTSTLAGPALVYNNSTNNTMRLVGVTQPLPVQMRTGSLSYQSTCFSTIGNNSTSSTIVSSAAGVRHKVYAYSITSTVEAVQTLTFASSLANPIWQLQLKSLSSAVSGANLAVTPPAFLFATEVANPLVFKVTGSTGSYHLSFSYFSEA